MVKSKPSATGGSRGLFEKGIRNRSEYLEYRISRLDAAIEAIDSGAVGNYREFVREYLAGEEINYRSVMNDWETFGPAGIYDVGHLSPEVLEDIRREAWADYMEGAGRGILVTERARLRRELAAVRSGQGTLI